MNSFMPVLSSRIVKLATKSMVEVKNEAIPTPPPYLHVVHRTVLPSRVEAGWSRVPGTLGACPGIALIMQGMTIRGVE